MKERNMTAQGGNKQLQELALQVFDRKELNFQRCL